MRVSDYMVDRLIKYGVTDAFGVPGGVILRFLESLNDTNGIEPHLNYHEQMAGFAACGYAQASGRLGVAYATRGPGITNMITSIAEAFQESLPVLFITAHGNRVDTELRFENNQELDVVKMVSKITKYAANIENIHDAKEIFERACCMALSERSGPVLIDVKSSLWDEEMPEESDRESEREDSCTIGDETAIAFDYISEIISGFRRPMILIGDGVRNAAPREALYKVAKKIKIPFLSSRGAQDILAGADNYYGYIGSHGVRYSNFILSKADLIITLGNRLAFPIESESFRTVIENARIVRLDIDEKEFHREIPGAVTYRVDASKFVNHIFESECQLECYDDWINVCDEIKVSLQECDTNKVVKSLSDYILAVYSKVFICDVGNNEFWFSRAYELADIKGSVYFSKSFGTLGVGIGRAIGVYYATKCPATCIIGDQGFQYNVQELQFLAEWELPITILVLNNYASGMIADHEKKIFGEKRIHVYEDCGYRSSNVKKIALAYGIPYTDQLRIALKNKSGPLIYELKMQQDVSLIPYLPKGNPCQEMFPLLGRMEYEALDAL